jgi:hypothetical protein
MSLRSISLLAWMWLGTFASVPIWAQAASQFFAGAVTEYSAEQLTVSRTIQGKPESKAFRITAETKVEGQLSVNARVTVGYEGDRATLIIVREDTKDKK